MTKEQIEKLIVDKAKQFGVTLTDDMLAHIRDLPGVGSALAAGIDGFLSHIGKDALIEKLVEKATDLIEDAVKAITGDDYGVVINAGSVVIEDNRE